MLDQAPYRRNTIAPSYCQLAITRHRITPQQMLFVGSWMQFTRASLVRTRHIPHPLLKPPAHHQPTRHHSSHSPPARPPQPHHTLYALSHPLTSFSTLTPQFSHHLSTLTSPKINGVNITARGKNTTKCTMNDTTQTISLPHTILLPLKKHQPLSQ